MADRTIPTPVSHRRPFIRRPLTSLRTSSIRLTTTHPTRMERSKNISVIFIYFLFTTIHSKMKIITRDRGKQRDHFILKNNFKRFLFFVCGVKWDFQIEVTNWQLKCFILIQDLNSIRLNHSWILKNYLN